MKIITINLNYIFQIKGNKINSHQQRQDDDDDLI